jgi:hypothetical protein
MVVFCINKIGRRGLIYLGLGIQVICQLFTQVGIFQYYKYFSIFFIYIYIFGFAISLGGTLYVYQSEILVPEMIPIAASVQWILTFIVSFADFGDTSKNNNNTFFLLDLLFFLTTVSGLFIFQGYSVETKRKSDSKILNDWRTKKFSY